MVYHNYANDVCVNATLLETKMAVSLKYVISEISKINSEAIKPYLGDLFPLIIECIKDMTSSTKRKEAIRTLISIIENTSFVVKPYFYFPELLEVI